jgi:hypothetical protein
MSDSTYTRTATEVLADIFDRAYNGDLSKLLESHHFGGDGGVSEGRSLPTRSMFSVSVPDAENPEAKFVYNYFVPTERAELHPKPKSVLYDSVNFNPGDIEYLARTEQTPRYVKLTFSPPSFGNTITVADLTIPTDKEGNPALHEEVNEFLGQETINVSYGADFLGNFSEALGETATLDDVISKLVVEGAASNPNFSGVEIVDTFADKKIYTMLSSSMVFQNIGVSANSPRERAQLFRDKISENRDIPNPLGAEKTELIDIITEMQPAGVSLAPSDVSAEDAQLATDPITKQSFSVKFNNLFFGDIVDYVSQNANTIYEDEFRGLQSIATQTQEALIASIDPTMTYEHDYQMKVQPLRIRELKVSQSEIDDIIYKCSDFLSAASAAVTATGGTFSDYMQALDENDISTSILNAVISGLIDPVKLIMSRENVPNMKIVGYLVQKNEIIKGGLTKSFPDMFIDNPKYFSEFIDTQVRYGAVYNYKIRTIAMCTSAIKVINQLDNTSKYCIADFLIASDGKNIAVSCVENVPPPPPGRVRARVDYEYRKPVITWEFPFNKQRDIKRFQVFKRSTIDDPFTLVAEYEFDNSVEETVPNETAQTDKLFKLKWPLRSYRDDNFNLKFDTAIYAIACVDAHGLSSNYSAQISVTYDKFTNRLHTNVICKENCPKPYPNLYISHDFFEDLIRSSGKKRCTVFFDPEYYWVTKTRDPEVPGIKEVIRHIKMADKRSSEDASYTIQFIDVDKQQDQVVRFKIYDRSGSNVSVPIAEISETNLSFEFGV